MSLSGDPHPFPCDAVTFISLESIRFMEATSQQRVLGSLGGKHHTSSSSWPPGVGFERKKMKEVKGRDGRHHVLGTSLYSHVDTP
jgi:hypothetical protein